MLYKDCSRNKALSGSLTIMTLPGSGHFIPIAALSANCKMDREFSAVAQKLAEFVNPIFRTTLVEALSSHCLVPTVGENSSWALRRSENHRMDWVGRYFVDHLVLTLCYGQGCH